MAEFEPGELRIDSYSGSPEVRVTHIPSGVTATVASERAQFLNLRLAKEQIRAELERIAARKLKALDPAVRAELEKIAKG